MSESVYLFYFFDQPMALAPWKGVKGLRMSITEHGDWIGYSMVKSGRIYMISIRRLEYTGLQFKLERRRVVLWGVGDGALV